MNGGFIGRIGLVSLKAVLFRKPVLRGPEADALLLDHLVRDNSDTGDPDHDPREPA